LACSGRASLFHPSAPTSCHEYVDKAWGEGGGFPFPGASPPKRGCGIGDVSLAISKVSLMWFSLELLTSVAAAAKSGEHSEHCHLAP